MKKCANSRRIQYGFSLVEMAIVMAIVGLLLGGLLPTLSAQREAQRIKETRKLLDEIQQALMGYAIINGRLPCPADGTIPTVPGVANGAGQQIAACPVGANGGVLPWITLGVSETDAWGRRFSYRVTPDFALTATPFQLTTPANLNVGLSTADNGVASGAPAVVVSHGPNGLGAYTSVGGAPIPGATGDELDNTDNNNHFVSHDFTPTFDDLVVWLSPNILLNRMITAGKLP